MMRILLVIVTIVLLGENVTIIAQEQRAIRKNLEDINSSLKQIAQYLCPMTEEEIEALRHELINERNTNIELNKMLASRPAISTQNEKEEDDD